VVGNDLDHKWVGPTVELLGTAFPLQSIYALGSGSIDLPNVTSIPSGKLSEEEIARLFTDARIIVFPSFYEGFGFPVLQGLSYGKQVLVRRSSLIHEIAARCRAEGRLYEFSSPMELLEIVTHLLRGHEPDSLPLGKALDETEEPMGWPDIARNMLHFMQAGLQAPAALQWPRRMQAIRLRQGWK
jgi:glycosyltransferase involved in cell wall biosynthesis